MYLIFATADLPMAWRLVPELDCLKLVFMITPELLFLDDVWLYDKYEFTPWENVKL
jgi:hypothetical protein